MNTRKISCSLPSETVAELDRIANFLGVSRSTVLTGMLQPALSHLSPLLDALSVPSDPSDGVRLKRAAYDQLDHLELLLKGVRDDAKSLQ